VIPVNERWLHESAVAPDLPSAMVWLTNHSPADADLEDTLNKMASSPETCYIATRASIGRRS